MFTFGTMAPFVRNINVSSSELSLYRAILAITMVGLYIFITKQKFDLQSIKKELLLLLLSGAFMGINWILLFEAYKYTTVSVATEKSIMNNGGILENEFVDEDGNINQRYWIELEVDI